MDIHPHHQAFLAVMRQQQDYVLYEYLAAIRKDAEGEELIDEGVAWEYAALVNMLEEERRVPPQTIEEVLDATMPLSSRDSQKLFDIILEESKCLKLTKETG